MLSPATIAQIAVSAESATATINPFYLIAVLVGLGLFFGFLLSYADKKIAVKLNPLIHEVEEVLPKGQCGACGYPGCGKYAEAVVSNAAVPPNLCIPGGGLVAAEVARLTGKAAGEVEPRVALVHCRGDNEMAKLRYSYDGIRDCRAAHALLQGGKACEYGCLGFGNCTKVCKFDALSMGENGLPIVDVEKCTGCGACVAACPRDVISLLPKYAKVVVRCRSHEKAGVVKAQCQVGCIGCGLCAKLCEPKAVKMVEFLPEIDVTICKSCENITCLAKCKTVAIDHAFKQLG